MSGTERPRTRRLALAWLWAAAACHGLWAAGAAPQREEYTRNFQKSVTLAAGQGVRLEHSNGDIVVRTHGSSELRIDASIRVSAASAADAAAFGNEIRIQVEPTATAIWIRTSYPESRRDSFLGLGRRNISYSVNYEIALPQAAPLQIRNRFGNVSVSLPASALEPDRFHVHL